MLDHQTKVKEQTQDLLKNELDSDQRAKEIKAVVDGYKDYLTRQGYNDKFISERVKELFKA